MEEKVCEFRESEKSLKQNWVQFKDPLCYLCLHGAVVSSLRLWEQDSDFSQIL